MDKQSIERIMHLIDVKYSSVRKLSEATGIASTTMHRYLTMENDIPNDKLQRIAKALDVSVEYIHFGDSLESHYSTMNPLIMKINEILDELNDIGIQKVSDYVEDLAENLKYRK